MSFEKKFIVALSDLFTRIPPDRAEAGATLGLTEQFFQLMKIMLEADRGELEELLGELRGEPQPLFNEVGRLIRNFYEQMKVIRSDIPRRLGSIANRDMEDAGHRLDTIVEMTETAANATMDHVEKLVSVLRKQDKADGTALRQVERALGVKDLPPSVEKSLKSVRSVLQARRKEHKDNQQKLTEILVAQSFHDLTGQVVQKIVGLLANLEAELLALISSFGKVEMNASPDSGGIAFHGAEQREPGTKQTQGDVDDLLNSLGF